MAYFKMTKEEYEEYCKKKTPNSKLFSNILKAFLVGGAICCLGQAIIECLCAMGLDSKTAGTWSSISLVFLGAVFTGLGLYGRLAKFAGAGTIVPITGFANAVVSPALEFKTEGYVTGTGAKMFIISGPVIVYGISASIVYGVILWLWGLFS